MNKELTPLEAIKEFRILVGDYEKKWDKKTYDYFMNNVNIIETELKNSQKTIDKLSNEIKHLKATDRRNKKKLKALELIKKLNPYTVVEVQGQWYLMIGNIFVKSPKIPITEEQASLLMEVLVNHG